MAPAQCRAAARALERACLRGPRPAPGLTGLRRALERACAIPSRRTCWRGWKPAWNRRCASPAAVEVAPAEALAALIEAAERLAATDETPGPARLWAGEEGEALATALTAAQAALPLSAGPAPSVLPGLLDAMLEGEMVRTRRALRGRGGGGTPARLHLGPAGGAAAIGGPACWAAWRRAFGRPPPIPAPGCPARCAPRSGWPRRRKRWGRRRMISSRPPAPRRSPCCPARAAATARPRCRHAGWRGSMTFLAGQRPAPGAASGAGWARTLDQPAGRPRPAAPPRPCPPVALRPRRLQRHRIETWLHDPYAIYARHVLKLTTLRPLEEATDAADYGSLVHAAWNFLRRAWPALAARAPAQLAPDDGARAGRGRSARVARGMVGAAPASHRRLGGGGRGGAPRHPPHAAHRHGGRRRTWTLDAPGGRFLLRPRRPHRAAAGRRAWPSSTTRPARRPRRRTSRPASRRNCRWKRRWPPPARSARRWRRGRGADLLAPDRRLSSRARLRIAVQGRRRRHRRGGGAGGQQAARADRRFDDPARGYLSQPHPARAPRFSDYGQLARVAEWDLAGEEA